MKIKKMKTVTVHHWSDYTKGKNWNILTNTPQTNPSLKQVSITILLSSNSNQCMCSCCSHLHPFWHLPVLMIWEFLHLGTQLPNKRISHLMRPQLQRLNWPNTTRWLGLPWMCLAHSALRKSTRQQLNFRPPRTHSICASTNNTKLLLSPNRPINSIQPEQPTQKSK